MRSVFKRRTAEARRLLIRTSASFEIDDSRSASDGAKWFSIIFQSLALVFFIWFYVGLPWLFRRLVGYPLGDSYNRDITIGGVVLPIALGILFNVSHYHVWGSDPGFKSQRSSSSRGPTPSIGTHQQHDRQLQSRGREEGNDAGNDEEEMEVPRTNTDVLVDPQAHQHQASDALGNELRWCEPCQHNQPIRSRHCRKCGCCVRKFDHHCFWVNTCVGERNHFRFTVLLFWATLYIMVGGVVVLSHIETGTTTRPPTDITPNYDAPTSRPLVSSCVTNTRSAIDVHCYLQTGTKPVCGGSCVVTWGVWWTFNAIPLLLGAVCVLMFVFTVSLLILHVFLLLSNQTTWEVSSGPPKNTITYLVKAQTPEPFNDGIIRNTRVALLAAALGGDIPPSWCTSYIASSSSGRSATEGMFLSSSDDEDYEDVPRTTDTSMEEGRSTAITGGSDLTTTTPTIIWPKLSLLGRILGGMGRVFQFGCWCCLRGALMRHSVRKLEKMTRGKSYCELKTSKKRWRELMESRGLSREVRHLVERPHRRWKTVISPSNYAAEFDTLEIEWHPF